MVRLLVNGHAQCGGSLIDERTVVTAAHCIFDSESGTLLSSMALSIVAGDHDLSIHESTEQHVPVLHMYAETTGPSCTLFLYFDFRSYAHEQYRGDALENDIAVLTLAKPVLFSEAVGPVCLPSRPSRQLVGTSCVAAGWGRLFDDAEWRTQTAVRLQEVDLSVLSDSICRRHYHQLHDESALCASNRFDPRKGTSFGDSGGPLVCIVDGQPQLVGLTSYGVPTYYGQGEFPSVFSDVYNYLGWIRSAADGTRQPSQFIVIEGYASRQVAAMQLAVEALANSARLAGSKSALLDSELKRDLVAGDRSNISAISAASDSESRPSSRVRHLLLLASLSASVAFVY
jgi:secreted trypsin-like serine protease